LTDACTHKFLRLATVLDTHIRLSALIENLEGKVFDICLHLGIIEFTADKTFGVKDTSIYEIK
jgi:hypothetical protein